MLSPRGGGTSPGVSCGSGPLRLRGPECTMDNKGKSGRVGPAGPRAEPRRGPSTSHAQTGLRARSVLAVWSDVVPLVTTKTLSLLMYPGNGSWVYPRHTFCPRFPVPSKNVRFRTNVRVFEVLISSYVKYE